MLGMLNLILYPLFSMGLSAGMGPEYFKESSCENRETVIWSAFLISIISGISLLILAWCTPSIFISITRLSNEYLNLIFLALTALSLSVFASPHMQSAQFDRKSLVFVFVNLFSIFASFFLSYYLVVYRNFGIVGILLGQIIANLIIVFGFCANTLKNYKVKVSICVIKNLLTNSLPLVPSFAFIFIIMHGNKYLLEWQNGLRDVGIYSVGFSFGTAFSIFTTSIATAWYPFFMSYKAKTDEAKIIFPKILTYYFYSVGLLCCGMFIFAKPIILFLTPFEFFESYKVIGFVSLGYFSQMCFNFFLPNLYYLNNLKIVSYVQGLSAIISIWICYVLIKLIGFTGAAIGLALGNVVMAVLLLLYNKKNDFYIKINYDWGKIAQICTLLFTCILVNSLVEFKTNTHEILKSLLVFLSCFFLLTCLLKRSEQIFIFHQIKKLYDFKKYI
jgi:O-antigen/teichoic acid export membrane protein